MSTKKISELVEITSTVGTEELVVNDGGTSKKIQMQNLPGGDLVEDLTPQLGGNLDTNGKNIDSVTPTELGRLSGVTSAIQTQINSKTNEAFVDTAVANLVDSSPAALNTLNELAAALGDDANFSTTVTNSIATKLPLAGGTMTGAIAMGANKVTGLGTPTATTDAATKAYVDALDALPSQATHAGEYLTTNATTASWAALTTDLVGDTTPQLGGDLDTNSKNISFGDSSGSTDDRLTFGDGNDLQIYHNGGDSFIDDAGNGNLRIRSNFLQIEKYTGETMATFNDDNAVSLFFNNAVKIATTSSGINVTGAIVTDGITELASGNVGIGTSSPNELLHVSSGSSGFTGSYNSRTIGVFESNSGAGTTLSIMSKNTGYSGIFFGDQDSEVDGGQLQFEHTTNAWKFVSSGSERMRIKSNGNVGIGTTNPSTKLEVSGSDGEIIRIESTKNGTWVDEDILGGFEIYGSDNSDAGPGVKTAIRALSKGTGGGKFSLAFTTSEAGFNDVERMRIDSVGNVGIGTTNPTYPLHINQPASTASYALFTNGTATSGTLFGIDADGDFIILNQENKTIKMYTNDTERLHIKSNGNVGIGTTSPGTLLDVRNNSDTSGATITAADNADREVTITSPITGAVPGRVSVGGTSNGLSLGVRDYSDVINISGLNGNVGIGTSSPSHPLHVSGAVEPVKISHTGGAGAGAACLIDRSNTGNAFWFTRSGTNVGSIAINTSSTSYNTASDYRLKENVVPMTGSIDRLKALNPSRFNFIINADTTVDGFLAHEAGEVVPEAISGTKDAMRTQEYEVTPALGDIFTPAIEEVTAEQPVMETVDGDTYVNLAGETITETFEVAVTNEVITTVIERQDIDGVMTEVEIERTTQEPVMKTVVTIKAVDEVIIESNVEQSESLEDGQQWRQTKEVETGEREVEDYQGIDQSKLVPLLVSAVQELTAKVEALESQLGE